MSTTPSLALGTDMRRTPSTSAIYETLRRSKELRESLSRPSSRLSVENERINVRINFIMVFFINYTFNHRMEYLKWEIQSQFLVEIQHFIYGFVKF